MGSLAALPYDNLQEMLLRQQLATAPISAYPQIQHSAYLSQALQDIAKTGGQNVRTRAALGSNLLAEALLAFASNKANQATNAAITNGLKAEGDSTLSFLGGGQDAGQGAAAPATAPAAATGAVAPSAPGAAGPPQPAGTGAIYVAPTPTNPLAGAGGSPGGGSALGGNSSPSQLALTHFLGEGYSPAGAAGLVGNFQQESGPNLSLNNPGEGAFGAANWRGDRLKQLQAFAASNKSDPSDLNTQLAFADQELNGPYSGVKAGLMNATDPSSAAAVAAGYERPRGWRPGGDPQLVDGWQQRMSNAVALFGQATQPGQSNPSSGPISTATAAQASPAPRPLQVSTGPDPSIPAPSAMQNRAVASPFAVAPQSGPAPMNGNLGQAGPAPSAAPASSASSPAAASAPMIGAPLPQAPQGPTSAYPGVRATPDELALLKRLYSNPRTIEQARTLAFNLMQRQATRPTFTQHYDDKTGQTTWVPDVPGAAPVQYAGPPQGWRAPPAAGYAYDRNGQLQPQWKDSAPVPLSPTAFGYQDPHGDWTVKEVPGLAGPLPEGTQVGPGGAVQPRPGASNAPYTPANIIALRDQVNGAKPITEARDALSNYGALTQLAQAPGGIKAYAARDALARLFSGGVARSSQVFMQEGAQGLPDSITGYFGKLTGDGDMDPRIMQQSLDAAYAFTRSKLATANQYNNSNAAFAQRHGFDPADIQADLGQAPAPYSVPGQRSFYAPAPSPGGSAQANAAQVIAQAQQAIARGAPRAQVIARVQRMGLNPAGL